MNYDLIVIGNTSVGRYTALTATFWEARVALVTQDISFSSEADELYNFTLTHLTQTTEKYQNIQPLISLPSDLYQKWTQEVIAIIQADSPLLQLTAKGVDVINGKGEFCRLPKPAFIINQETLEARAYLIATETVPIFPEISNLSEVGYLNLTDLRQKETLETLPKNLTILGETPQAITFAQNLARLNKKITLSLPNHDLLPKEDQTISYYLQSQLEADGINILKHSPLLQIQQIHHHKWLQLGRHAIETDELIIIPETKPNLKGLNLESVGVSENKQGLIVNEKLQTTNPKIYASGSVIGGYSYFNIAQQEAIIALKNALFFPCYTIDYQPLPCLLSTHPPLGRVGMTEAQARQRYGDKIVVLEEYFKHNLINVIQGEVTGIFKLIIHQNGDILGAHCLGKNAGELVSVISIVISKKIKIQHLHSFTFPSPSVLEIISQILQKWEKYLYQNHPFLRWLRRRYFISRRPLF